MTDTSTEAIISLIRELQGSRKTDEFQAAVHPAINTLRALTAEVERCHNRLEIDRAFRVDGDDLVRFEIPMHERADFTDKITCLGYEIDEITIERDALREAQTWQPIDHENKPTKRALLAFELDGIKRVAIGGWDNHWTGKTWVYENRLIPNGTVPTHQKPLPTPPTKEKL